MVLGVKRDEIDGVEVDPVEPAHGEDPMAGLESCGLQGILTEPEEEQNTLLKFHLAYAIFADKEVFERYLMVISVAAARLTSIAVQQFPRSKLSSLANALFYPQRISLGFYY